MYTTLFHDNKFITDFKEKAELFNSFFEAVLYNRQWKQASL